MDIASLIGIIIGAGCLGFVGMEACHGHWAMFYSQEGVFMVFGGSISVAFMAMPMNKIKCMVGWLKRFMFNKARDPAESAKLIGEIADKARREGILALEGDYTKIKESDPFLATGLRMTIDGMDPSAVEQTLRLEIMAMAERHKAGKKFFDLIKLYGPGYGLVGTLVGQIGMFGNLEGGSIGAMGKMLAVAVCATMYGTIVANAVAGPIGDKLAMRSSEEMMNREMVLQGILSVMNGDNPRITVEKMMAFVPMAARAKIQAAA
ncbi:MAG TPA: MotA/TolQ/ExbB proton channel family protein [Phycisphaerae bacterium]|nr:MotA/TolQ/ExbB proton channel family protein [Phycisphaerae bacterium]